MPEQSDWVQVASGEASVFDQSQPLGKVDYDLAWARHPCAAYCTFWSGEAVRLVTSHRADDA